MRDYFGTKLSFYFAFLGFYTINLVRPALYGLAVHVIRVVGLGGDSHVQGLTASDWVLVGSVYVVCAWRSVAVLMVHARDCGVSVCVSVCMCVCHAGPSPIMLYTGERVEKRDIAVAIWGGLRGAVRVIGASVPCSLST